ncbi:MAG: discoidin domain-containing protein [Sedimentisphaerales bacterium]|nr:discoidin domain-containing protein [Sedimentisphaerales bacterium]
MARYLICFACLSLVSFPSLIDRSRAADPAIVGWWRLDEKAGTTAADSSGLGNHGTVQGTPRWASGMIDGALYLDGTSNYVELPVGRVIRSLTDATFALWVMWTGPQSDSDWQRIFEFGVSGAAYMFLSPSAGLGEPMRFVLRTSLGGREDVIRADASLDNAWHHVAVVVDSTNSLISLYLDGELTGSGPMTYNKLNYMGATFYNWLGRSTHDTPKFRGWIDDFYIFNRTLSQQEVMALQAGGGLAPGIASNPVPADRQTDVSRDAVLQWTAGPYAKTHNVYLGKDLQQVQNADIGSPLLICFGQATCACNSGRLEFGQKYYWRVDEINGPPDYTVLKGDVWSFTVEPYDYPIPYGRITATASSYMEGREPSKTIDGSGLTSDDKHSTNLADMWQTAKGTSLPAWIQYEFDKPYKLSKMLVWNYNGASLLAVLGIKDVLVEYSMDGLGWIAVAGVSQFPMASGAVDHTADITIDLDGIAARYIRITAKSNYSGGFYSQCGLSEVRFMAVPVSARDPQPSPGAQQVDLQSTLSWRQGREADRHLIYLGTEQSAVSTGTAQVYATKDNRLALADLNLRLGQTYYWRVDEVNDTKVPAIWPGDIWSFTTADHIIIDDFESYGNGSPNRPFQTWIDGLGFTEPAPGNPGNNTGAAVGHDIWTLGSQHYQALIMELDIVHGGRQSLPIYYDNSGTNGRLNYSQIDRIFPAPQDWTRFGTKTLLVHFYGMEGNTGLPYVKINDVKLTYPGKSADIAAQTWITWEIDLSTLPGGASRVSSLSFGIDGAGASGLIYLDDIWLR